MNLNKKSIAYISLGTNKGDEKKNLNEAVSYLKKKAGKVIIISSVYKTEPKDVLEKQDDYYNMVLALETDFSAKELMILLLSIEKNMGRKRKKFNSARVIDLDLLFYDQEVLDSNILILPHPRMHQRNFVLQPLKEIAPELNHPVLKQTVAQLAKTCQDTCRVEFYTSFHEL